MHGDVDRNEASKRLLKVKRIGQYLVRMKGSSGRVFVFSFLFALDKEPSHTLIQFGDERQIHIDGKPIAAACSSLTDAVSLLCQITSDKYAPAPPSRARTRPRPRPAPCAGCVPPWMRQTCGSRLAARAARRS